MALQVTCPSCLKRFSVSEKFAGKSGPCPNCTKPIKIPELTEQVVIHGPAEAGPKETKGRPVFKPIKRREVSLSTPVIAGIAVAVVTVLAIALIVRFTMPEPPSPLLIMGALLLAPPLVYAGYFFLHEDELEGYTGQPLLIRCGVCALVFAATWGLYAFIPTYVKGYDSIAEIGGLDLVWVIPIMVAVGMFASVIALELEVYQGALHYLLYVAITLALALIMGTKLASPFAGEVSAKRAPPSANQPAPAAGADQKKAPIKVLQ